MAQRPNKHCSSCGGSHAFVDLGDKLVSLAPGCRKELQKFDEPQPPKVVEPPRGGGVWTTDLRIGDGKKPQ